MQTSLSIGERIKQRRTQLELTQTELAEAAGVTQKQIWRYETNQSVPYADVAAKIAKMLDTTTDWLLGASDAVRPAYAISDLSEEELELINIVRGKSPDAARKLIEVAKVI